MLAWITKLHVISSSSLAWNVDEWINIMYCYFFFFYLQEEQTGGSSTNYDVELIHLAEAHRDILRAGGYKNLQ
jgi:hypothetical protein